MQTRVGGETGNCRPISAGSPQGSILGCYLYCATTQQLNKGLVDFQNLNLLGGEAAWNGEAGEEAEEAEDLALLPGNATSTPSGRTNTFSPDRTSSEEEADQELAAGFDLIGAAVRDDSVLGPNAVATRPPLRRLFDSDSSNHTSASSTSTDSFETAKNASVDILDFIIEVYKNVDDTTIVEAIELDQAQLHLTTRRTNAKSRSRYTELVSNAIANRAEEIGMRVNCKKTQLLLVSPPNGCNNNAFVKLCGERIESTSELKLLGFVFGNEPNVNLHVEHIKKKFRARFWALVHLRNSGLCGDQIIQLFNVFLRPIIEYCCIIYHPLLTKAQI